MGTASKVALYTAGAVLGITAGVFAMKVLNHRMEFKADAFAKKLMGESESMDNALKTLVKTIGQHKGLFTQETEMTPNAIKVFDQKRAFLGKLLHPSMEKRISTLAH